MAAHGKEYLINRIKTASPIELVVIAYDSAINFLQQAKDDLSQNQVHEGAVRIIKSQNIIRELRRSLDKDIVEISDNLTLLYRFMDKQLTAVQRGQSSDGLDRVIKMLSELKEAWEQVARTAGTAAPAAPQAASYISIYK
jgi:flagellar protein FliS